MKITKNSPPRIFEVGLGAPVKMTDCAHIELNPDEQITLKTEKGLEFDVARKSWGFYATPSLNGRLESFGLRGVLVKGPTGKFFVWLVESGKEEDFHDYLNTEKHHIICWLDNDESLNYLERALIQGKK